jgi:hypothetical protein
LERLLPKFGPVLNLISKTGQSGVACIAVPQQADSLDIILSRWRAGGTGSLRRSNIFLQHTTPQASAFGHVQGAQLSSTFEPGTMTKSSVPPNAPIALPPLVATYVEATNNFDLEGLIATFAEDALVNDQLRDYWGKPAIREWAIRDIIGERLTMNVTNVINHHSNFIVTANVDGNYDKRGLPDPLVLAFYFTAQSDLIVQLIILRNRFDI